MKKAVSKSKKTQSTPTKQEPDEFLILGHLIKYNLLKTTDFVGLSVL